MVNILESQYLTDHLKQNALISRYTVPKTTGSHLNAKDDVNDRNSSVDEEGDYCQSVGVQMTSRELQIAGSSHLNRNMLPMNISEMSPSRKLDLN